MYLQKLEIQGFKSFAPKTNLEFLLPKDGRKGITAIVGPNGSGKSNVADAIRWALGEQSMKAIRGKRGEDIIFSGSDKKTRSGFAEVSLCLDDNHDKENTPYSEVVLTRRFFRNGDSEYLLNKNKARLSDIHLTAAKSNIGSRSYSVVGQGMIDKILTLSDEERKDFFNEATGIKQYQIKKEQSLNKLSATIKNLEQVEIVLGEIEPRLRSLRRQSKKLEEREEIELKLHELEYKYYGSLWEDIEDNIVVLKKKLEKIEKEWKEKRMEISTIQKEFSCLEKEKPGSQNFLSLQNKYQRLLEEKNQIREKEWKIKNLITNEESRGKGKSLSISISKIAQEINEINARQKKLIKDFRMSIREGVNTKKLEKAILAFEKLENTTDGLLKEIAGKPQKTNTNLSGLFQKLETIKKESEKFEQKILNAKEEIQKLAKKEEEEKSAFFEKQRKLEARQNEIFSLESVLNNLKIELARFETKREGVEEEMKLELGEKFYKLKNDTKISREERQEVIQNKNEIFQKIQRFKRHMELIGGIDPETPKEYEEINERYEFLHNESHDLKNSIKSLEAISKELNIIIEKQFNRSFSRINDYFTKYFKTLFDGGSARIVKVNRHKPNFENEEEPSSARAKKNKDFGIEIHATPPGKKIKNLEILSGGEKALTAIALLCAIMANNPSPFVVLDEVDAALDEANSIKFADILYELSKKTQFIVITHNRATMGRASVLYGVTMQENGVSKLLSMKLEDKKS